MDTSDSDYFESADEFQSDCENSEESTENSAINDAKTLEKSTKDLNIDDCSTDDKHKREKKGANSSKSKDIEYNETDVLQESLHVKNYEDNTTISKKIANIESLVKAQGNDTVKQYIIIESKGEKQLVQNIYSTCSRTVEQDKEEVDNTSQEPANENMWANDEWEPMPINDNENSSVDKDNELVHLPSNSIEENAWDNDDWEPIEVKDIDNNAIWQTDESKGVVLSSKGSSNDNSWGSWGTWGVSSILNTATQGVSTLTNQVSQGISNVLESGMGIPNPEQLAQQHHHEEEKIMANLEHIVETRIAEDELEIKNQDNNFTGFGYGNLSNLVSGVSNLTKFVEHTGTKVINGGLDTLETIGKKTMEVLQDGDPGLKNKRAFLKLDKDKPVLSQVLREAKTKAEEENEAQQHLNETKKLNYESLLDDYHGLVHLEALEMLSKQCDIKLKSLSNTCRDRDTLREILETLEQVRELCELPDEDDEDQSTLEEIEEKIKSALEEIDINISYDKCISFWKETENWLNKLQLNICEDHEVHQEALKVLAQLTAVSLEQFHKAGELLLIKEHRSTADEADSLVQLTTSLTSLIGIAAGKFSEKLNAKATGSLNKEIINDRITNVFFEAANSSSYIQDAFQLLIPVIQVGAFRGV